MDGLNDLLWMGLFSFVNHFSFHFIIYFLFFHDGFFGFCKMLLFLSKNPILAQFFNALFLLPLPPKGPPIIITQKLRLFRGIVQIA